ncbi:CO dehydrogenase/acetyl-CoA synthase subunit delta [Candidatus Bathyarchaeota archaeon]|nr:CO dehydrogenase/acetyl-CoA synthase subunit delta [Candidatus Bathyarchaeota archaeon]
MEKKKEEKTIKLGPKLLELLSKLGEIELEDVEIEAEELEIWLPPAIKTVAPPPKVAPPKAAAPPKPAKPTEILEAPFTPLVEEYPGKIREVTLGATKSEGGSRGKTIVIGGENSPSYYLFERAPPHPPVISVDVFDMAVSLPKAIKMHVKEVMGDPAEWAKMAVDKFGADLVTVELMSTDPLIKNASPKQAAKTVEEVLQAVDVPIIIGGCGDPKKDAEVFTEIAEITHGERVLLSSLTLDMDEAGVLNSVAEAAGKHGHAVLAFTALDLNRAKELNRKLYPFVPADSVIMDLTTAALGYGLEYTFSIHERARMAALMGDEELQHPTLSGTTNAWAAREAWMKMGPEWEPRELRGPIWETVTALVLFLAGVDLFMMMHPYAIRTMKKIIKEFSSMGKSKPEKISEWISVKI